MYGGVATIALNFPLGGFLIKSRHSRRDAEETRGRARGPGPRSDPHALAQRNPKLELTLDVPPSLRRLARVRAVEEQRLCEVVAVCDLEQTRPQVEVLAIATLGVAAA